VKERADLEIEVPLRVSLVVFSMIAAIDYRWLNEDMEDRLAAFSF
jgi:hypothetical protein